jgi:hypothetical protein
MKLGFTETQDLASLYGILLAHFNVVKAGEEKSKALKLMKEVCSS